MAEVAGTKKAVRQDGLGRGFRVVEVAHEVAGRQNFDFAGLSGGQQLAALDIANTDDGLVAGHGGAAALDALLEAGSLKLSREDGEHFAGTVEPMQGYAARPHRKGILVETGGECTKTEQPGLRK